MTRQAINQYLFAHIQYGFIVLAIIAGVLLTNFLLTSELSTPKRLAVQGMAIWLVSLLMSYLFENWKVDFKLFLALCAVAGGGGEQVVYWVFYTIWWKNKNMDESLSAIESLATKFWRILDILRGRSGPPTNPTGSDKSDTGQ